MRIAHITVTFPPYEAGTGRVAYFNALQLARLGHEVTVITAAHPPGEYDYPANLEVMRLPVAFRIGNAPLLPQLRFIDNFDILHLHYPFIFGADLMWYAARKRQIPYVLTHHNDLMGSGWRQLVYQSYSRLNRGVVSGAQKFIAVSFDHAANCELTPIFKRRWEDVIEVSNGVDLEIFNPEIGGQNVRQQHHMPDDAVVIGFVGSLDLAHQFKGVDRLIKAFARVGDPKARLMIVGEGELRPGLEQLANDQNIRERTVFVGRVPHDLLGAYYAALDVLVLPSSPPESFGMVLVEAGASRKPVIASNIPGVRSVIENEVTGLLVTEGDINDLAAKLRRLIDDADLRCKMGQAGYERVLARYTWLAIGQRLEQVYRSVIDNLPQS